MAGVFRFKQFEVRQEGSAMRINTDGVLIAAIATQKEPAHILDIGTGTGVIALMLAQRYPEAFVDAVEVDLSAAETARYNFENSPFELRMNLFPADILHFDSIFKYDLVVSNPPYFVNDLKNTEPSKSIARHADEDFFEQMVRKVSTILSEDGVFWVILPVKQARDFISKAMLYNLFPCRIIHVFSDEDKPEFRQIICLSFADVNVKQENFYIYASKSIYTEAYLDLIRDFFLAFK
jgi:tRNA1Val (adenine37-N6)-methyltransferase